MAAFFHSAGSSVTLEVGEYEDFAQREREDAAVEKEHKPKVQLVSLVLLSFGLLCVLQGTLNICLRVAMTTPAAEDGGCEEARRCPQGWLAFSSSCYWVSEQARSWDGSRRHCLQNQADLAVVDGPQEQDFLSGVIAAAWVGMSDREEEGRWMWVDGTPVDFERSRWAPGQPDGAYGGEDCGDLRAMVNFTGLNDYSCRARNRWICERPL